MFSVYVETLGDVAVVQCEGRLVRSEAAFELRDAVLSLRNARLVIVDLSELQALEGGGLGMLGYLHRWAQDHDIKIKLFNPSRIVQERLARAWIPTLEIASTDEMIALLAQAERSQTGDWNHAAVR